MVAVMLQFFLLRGHFLQAIVVWPISVCDDDGDDDGHLNGDLLMVPWQCNLCNTVQVFMGKNSFTPHPSLERTIFLFGVWILQQRHNQGYTTQSTKADPAYCPQFSQIHIHLLHKVSVSTILSLQQMRSWGRKR